MSASALALYDRRLSLTIDDSVTLSDSALVFAPEGGFPGAGLVAARPGDGSSADITALYATQGTGVPGQIVYGDFCLTSEGVVPGTATQTLYFAECSDSPAQVWTVNESPATVSNADGNCISLGRAANGVPVSACFVVVTSVGY